MSLRHIVKGIDLLVFTFCGLTTIELASSIAAGHSEIIFSDINDGVKSLFSFGGLIYLYLRMIFYYRKSKAEVRKMNNEIQIQEQELKAMQIKNFQDENGYYAFKKAIDDNLSPAQIKESADRLK